MLRKSKAILSAATMLFMTVAVAAADDTLPRIDFEKFCRSRSEAVGELAGRTTQELFNSCVTTEQKAQTALVAAWKDIPATYKERCIKPNAYSPSYAEWIGCLELLIQVKNLPKD